MADSVLEWLGGKSPEELDVVEFEHRSLYPDTIKRRNPKDPSEILEKPIRLRVPNSRDRALARLDALQWAAELMKQQGHKPPEALTIPNAEACFGRVYFDELDTKCLLARCILEHDAPHMQYLLPELLDKNHEHASLMELWDRLNFYVSLEQVQVQELTEERFLAIVAAIDRRRNLSPFVAIGGSARDSFIISMASRLQSFLTRSCCSPSTETSTPTETGSATSSPGSSLSDG